MKNKYVFTAVLLAVILVVGTALTTLYVQTEQKNEQAKDGDLLVVTSFYPMYVAAENVIGNTEGVTLENLSEPQTGCLHDYQLTAADMKLLSKADVFIVNGGGIETFLSDVAESYPNLKIIQACDGIELLESAEGTDAVDESDDAHVHETEDSEETHADEADTEHSEDAEHADTDIEEHSEDAEHADSDHSEETTHADTEEEHSEETDHVHTESDAHTEDIEHDSHDHSEHDHAHGDNAHVWMNLEDYQQQIQNICQGLSEADAQHAAQYQANTQIYQEKVQELQTEAAELKAQIQSQPVVVFHEAYEYIVQEYGLELAGEMNLDEERQVSAGEVADILHAIEDNHVSVVLAEELYGSDMGEMVAKQSGVKVIYLDTLTRGDYSADSYLEGMRNNIEKLKEAFQ